MKKYSKLQGTTSTIATVPNIPLDLLGPLGTLGTSVGNIRNVVGDIGNIGNTGNIGWEHQEHWEQGWEHWEHRWEHWEQGWEHWEHWEHLAANDSCHMSRDIVLLLFGAKCRQHVLLLHPLCTPTTRTRRVQHDDRPRRAHGVVRTPRGARQRSCAGRARSLHCDRDELDIPDDGCGDWAHEVEEGMVYTL